MRAREERSSPENIKHPTIMNRDQLFIMKDDEELENNEGETRSSSMNIVRILTINKHDIHSNIEIKEEYVE